MKNTEIKIRLEKILVRNEQRAANKLIPSDILDLKDIIKQLSICDVVSCVCKIPEPRMKNSENGVSSYCNKCAKSYSQK